MGLDFERKAKHNFNDDISLILKCLYPDPTAGSQVTTDVKFLSKGSITFMEKPNSMKSCLLDPLCDRFNCQRNMVLVSLFDEIKNKNR